MIIQIALAIVAILVVGSILLVGISEALRSEKIQIALGCLVLGACVAFIAYGPEIIDHLFELFE